MDHELETLELFIEETWARFESRRRLREANSQDNIQYPSETSLNKLDSSIKKNSAFVKKLKVLTESQKGQILIEIDKLNLTKFISEVASSIIEAKLKLSDIPAVIEICIKLNQNYKDFSRKLLDQYIKYFPAIKKRNHDSPLLVQPGFNLTSVATPVSLGSSSPQTSCLVNKGQIGKNLQIESSTPNLSKIRVDLRLFAELVVSGVFPLKDSFPILMNVLYYLMVFDKNSHQNSSAILTFCKGCSELHGSIPKKIQALATKYNKQLPASDLIPVKRQEVLRNNILEYYQSLLKIFFGLHEELSEIVIKNEKNCRSKRGVTRDSKELLELKYSECQKLQSILLQLAEILGEAEPNLPDFDFFRDESKENDVDFEMSCEAGCFTASKGLSIWDDEGTRSFYEDLLDLRTLFPNLTVKITTEKKKVENQVQKRNVDEPEQSELPERKIKEDTGNSRDSTPTKEDGSEELEKPLSSSSSEESLNVGEVAPLVMSQIAINRVQPDQYYNKLPSCVNRDMIDNAAADFIKFFNTKFGRKKLVKTLFNVQRTRLDLLPFFARLTATIYRYVPSVGNELVNLLRQDFRNLFKKKDQINIESKVKNVRFIGELVKFNLYSKEEALICLKMLLSDFTHHHIEMTCNLLETCGRLLYKSPESHHQLKTLLEQMMRKKLLLSIDSKYVTMIENAYYFTNPPEIIRHVVKEPPVHIYVRYLLCECVNRSTIDFVLQKIKKLDWEDTKLAKFVINCMIEAYNLKFYNIRYLAALLAAMNKENQWISIAVVDGVVEDILLMVEINEIQFNQRRIPMIRYFGELFNYKLSDSSLVFKILYSLITYGVFYPEPVQTLSQIPLSQLDLPDNLFRIKLVCDLLETCGQYLNSGQDKKKLDCYLLFLQRYYWCKKHIYMLHPYCMTKTGNQFPASIEYLFNDTIYNLRPTFRLATSYPGAILSVQNFIDNLIADQQS